MYYAGNYSLHIEAFPTLFLPALIRKVRKVLDSPGSVKCATAIQSSAEVILSSGGADGLFE